MPSESGFAFFLQHLLASPTCAYYVLPGSGATGKAVLLCHASDVPAACPFRYLGAVGSAAFSMMPADEGHILGPREERCVVLCGAGEISKTEAGTPGAIRDWMTSVLRRYGRLEETPQAGVPDATPASRLANLAGQIGAALVELARSIDDPDTRLELGLRVKSLLKAAIAEARGEETRQHRQLAVLMFDALRYTHVEDVTPAQVAALQECADCLVSPTVKVDQLRACDQVLLTAGMDSLPDVPDA